MNNTILYFVTSPFQIRAAIKHRKKGKHWDATFLVVTGKKSRLNNYLQMKSIVDELLLDGSKVISVSYTHNYLYEFQLNLATYKLKKNYDLLCVGDIRDIYSFILYQKFKCKKMFLVDDGAASIVVRKENIKNGMAYPLIVSRYDKIRTVLYKLFGYNLRQGVSIEVCSIFEGYQVNNQNVDTLILMGKDVFFIGSKYSESGIISLNDELSAINYVSNIYSEANFIYIPHRDDSEIKIEMIKKTGINVLDANMPIEDYFEILNIIPSVIAGFWTTALYTLSRKYSFKRVDSFDISSLVENEKLLKGAKTVYSYYRDVGINVTSIDRDDFK